MKMTLIKATPLYLEFKASYYWAQGTNYGARVVPIKGRLAAIDRPGLGFEIDEDAVMQAAEAYERLAN